MSTPEQTVLADETHEATPPPTLQFLVTDSLIAAGFGGLFNEWGDCGCRIGDLFPCGAPSEDCTGGYVHEAAAGSDRFVVSANRTPPQDEQQDGATFSGTDEETSE
jgi:hypothetical protein